MTKQRKAHLLSTLFMGLGQLIVTKEYIKGCFFAVIEIITLLNIQKIITAINGLVTLGTVTGYSGTDIVKNDHSIVLLIKGILMIILLLLVAGIYFMNMQDAKSAGRRLDQGFKPRTFKAFIANFWDKAFPYIMISPAAMLVLFFIVLPISFGILLAFTNYAAPNNIPPKNLVDWVGLKNISDMINLPMWNNTFVGIFTWNIVWAVSASATCYFAGLMVALMLNSKWVKLKKMWRTIFILPYSVPALISLLIWFNLANGQFGPINLTLKQLGIIDPYFGWIRENIGWLSDPTIARFTVIFVNLWLGFPYFMALLTGILTSISDELYEAANMDGATAIQKFRHITLPMVIQATIPIITMTFAANFNNFNSVYFLTAGGPQGTYDAGSGAGSTDILITWIYKLTMDRQMYNIAALMSLLIFIVIGTFSVYNFRKTSAFKDEV